MQTRENDQNSIGTLTWSAKLIRMNNIHMREIPKNQHRIYRYGFTLQTEEKNQQKQSALTLA